MTKHATKAKHKKDKMVTFLVSKPFFDRMKTVVEECPDDELTNMSDLVRLATKKEMNRRQDV